MVEDDYSMAAPDRGTAWFKREKLELLKHLKAVDREVTDNQPGRRLVTPSRPRWETPRAGRELIGDAQ
jgi:hypothetical protein